MPDTDPFARLNTLCQKLHVPAPEFKTTTTTQYHITSSGISQWSQRLPTPMRTTLERQCEVGYTSSDYKASRVQLVEDMIPGLEYLVRQKDEQDALERLAKDTKKVDQKFNHRIPTRKHRAQKSGQHNRDAVQGEASRISKNTGKSRFTSAATSTAVVSGLRHELDEATVPSATTMFSSHTGAPSQSGPRNRIADRAGVDGDIALCFENLGMTDNEDSGVDGCENK